jgi:hypothetical protein
MELRRRLISEKTPTQIFHTARRFFQPSPELQRRELTDRYEAYLRNYAVDDLKAMDRWLNEWKYFHDCGTSIGTDWAESTSRHFLDILKQDVPKFYEQNILLVRTKMTEFNILIEKFRVAFFQKAIHTPVGIHIRGQGPVAQSGEQSRDTPTTLLAALGNSPLNQRPHRRKGLLTLCICRKRHRYVNCWYLNPNKRPSD